MSRAPTMYADRFRYVLLLLGFLCLTSICSNYIIINFTFICMANDTSDQIDTENGTLVSRYNYNPKEKSAIIWAVALGTILGTFPINYAYIRFGARWPFFISGMLSVISTAAIPLAARTNILFLLVFRFIQLCESSLGWRSAYYFHAGFGLLMFILWLVFYQDDPQLHPSVSEKELEKIQRNKTRAHIERDSFVPYREILKNKVILVVWFNAFVEMVTVTLLLVYAPLYFHVVLGYNVATTGILVSFAASIHLPLKFAGGVLSDRIKSSLKPTI
ncbi:unnamed protein product [Nippostrongylus brasiliensis]|uniref:MFS domain-containing protein n=1 Tax=Nippostrongylus brasiliensis TaxID=27835 RepID=A0A0N4YJ39_NIPBR|nr:unnamed protein product [Nippostrongylus brasiliensis]